MIDASAPSKRIDDKLCKTKAEATLQALGDDVSGTVDEQEGALVQGQRSGLGTVHVRQTTIERLNDVGEREWEDVDRAARTLRLSWRESKNKTARTMALVGELAAIIERRWQARTITTKAGAMLLSPLVFHRGPGTGKHQGQAQPVGDFDKAFKRACQSAGIPYGRSTGKTFHCFRRTASRNLRNVGVPENVCVQITGHKTRSMFDRYAVVNEADVADAMAKVQAHIQEQPVETNVIALRGVGR